MRPPFWQSLLSYLHEIPIEDAPSYVNPHLFVNLSRGRYQLVTRNAIYSYGDLYDNFVRAFSHLQWHRLQGNDMLLLGLGLGSIPYMLERKFQKQFQYTAIESDEQVIYLAKKYVTDTLHSSMEIIQDDAVRYINNSLRRWGIICLDLFIDDVIPQEAQTAEFMKKLNHAVLSNGLLLYNCLARTREDMNKSKYFLENVFLPVFPNGGYLDVGGNWMLINDKRFFESSSHLRIKAS